MVDWDMADWCKGDPELFIWLEVAFMANLDLIHSINPPNFYYGHVFYIMRCLAYISRK